MPRIALVLALSAGALPLAACNTSKPLKLESTFKLEGPVQIQMQMQGPVVRYTGVFVSETLFEQVKPDKTSEVWLLAAFGEPDRRTPAAEGGELLVWAYRLTAVEGSGLNLLSVGEDKEKTPTNVTTIIRVAGGVVVEKWRG